MDKGYMEHMGQYYEPVATWLFDAGILVSTDSILIKDFEDNSLCTPKTDKADFPKLPVTSLTIGQN